MVWLNILNNAVQLGLREAFSQLSSPSFRWLHLVSSYHKTSQDTLGLRDLIYSITDVSSFLPKGNSVTGQRISTTHNLAWLGQEETQQAQLRDPDLPKTGKISWEEEPALKLLETL